MPDIATNLFAFVIVLGFLIFFHEAGHFFVAKLFKVRVLVFSFGFGKRLFGFRKGDTDYRVSLIPLGGYVRMAGDNPEENVPGNPDEFLSKPKWQRFLILFAGPFMNIVIAIAFMAVLPMAGIQEVVIPPVVGEVVPDKPAAKAGLQYGDRIVSINDNPILGFDELKMTIALNAGTPLRVVYERNGVRHATTLTPVRDQGEYGPVGLAGFGNWIDPVVRGVQPGTPAAAAGLRAGDRIVAANGKPVGDLLQAAKIGNDPSKPLTMRVERNGEPLTLTLGPDSGKSGGVRGAMPEMKTIKLALLPALQYSANENWKMLKMTGHAIARLFRAEGSVKELSGPINIARISGDALRDGGILGMIYLMAMISLQLGVMNLLPIPVLDGGHIMILLIEGVARRDLSLQVKERIQQVGFAVLATLMIVVIYNDVISNVLRLRNG